MFPSNVKATPDDDQHHRHHLTFLSILHFSSIKVELEFICTEHKTRNSFSRWVSLSGDLYGKHVKGWKCHLQIYILLQVLFSLTSRWTLCVSFHEIDWIDEEVKEWQEKYNVNNQDYHKMRAHRKNRELYDVLMVECVILCYDISCHQILINFHLIFSLLHRVFYFYSMFILLLMLIIPHKLHSLVSSKVETAMFYSQAHLSRYIFSTELTLMCIHIIFPFKLNFVIMSNYKLDSLSRSHIAWFRTTWNTLQN